MTKNLDILATNLNFQQDYFLAKSFFLCNILITLSWRRANFAESKQGDFMHEPIANV